MNDDDFSWPALTGSHVASTDEPDVEVWRTALSLRA